MAKKRKKKSISSIPKRTKAAVRDAKTHKTRNHSATINTLGRSTYSVSTNGGSKKKGSVRMKGGVPQATGLSALSSGQKQALSNAAKSYSKKPSPVFSDVVQGKHKHTGKAKTKSHPPLKSFGRSRKKKKK